MVKAKNNFTYGNLGSGSDYASFYQFVGTFLIFIFSGQGVRVVSACFTFWTLERTV
jgi:hypothetical protein